MPYISIAIVPDWTVIIAKIIGLLNRIEKIKRKIYYERPLHILFRNSNISYFDEAVFKSFLDNKQNSKYFIL